MLKFKKPSLIKIPSYSEFNGTLKPFYINSSFPDDFKLKRIFILYGKHKYFRADHAHKKCSQIIVPLNGEITIEIQNIYFKKKITLNYKKNKALMIPPFNWIKIIFKKNNDSLITFCDYKYDKSEYISDYKEFKLLTKKK